MDSGTQPEMPGPLDALMPPVSLRTDLMRSKLFWPQLLEFRHTWIPVLKPFEAANLELQNASG